MSLARQLSSSVRTLCVPQPGMHLRIFSRTVFYNKNRTPLDNMIRLSREKLKWRQGDSLADMFEQDEEAKSVAGTESKFMSNIAIENVSVDGNQSWERKKYRVGRVVLGLVEDLLIVDRVQESTKQSAGVKKLLNIDVLATGFRVQGVRVSDNCAHCSISWTCINQTLAPSTQQAPLPSRNSRKSARHKPLDAVRKPETTKELLGAALEKIIPALRFEIGKRLDTKFVPSVVFRFDQVVVKEKVRYEQVQDAIKKVEREYRTDLRNVPNYEDEAESEIGMKLKDATDSIRKAQEASTTRDARMGRRPERGRQSSDARSEQGPS